MTAEQLHRFATEYTSAWCSQEPDRVAVFFAPAGSLTINQEEPATGRIAIAAAAQAFMSAFPDLTVRMHSLVFRDGRATYHWTLTGTYTGAGGSGNLVNISGFEV